MRFFIQHPSNSNLRASYGWDHAVGWFLTVESDGEVEAEYDQRLNPEMLQLAEVLEKFLLHGFFNREDLEEALKQMQSMEYNEMEPALAKIVDVVSNLKQAAD